MVKSSLFFYKSLAVRQRFLPDFRPDKTGIEFSRLGRKTAPRGRTDALGHDDRHRLGTLCSDPWRHHLFRKRRFRFIGEIHIIPTLIPIGKGRFRHCRFRCFHLWGRGRLTPGRYGNGSLAPRVLSLAAQEVRQDPHQDDDDNHPYKIHGHHLLFRMASIVMVVVIILYGRRRLGLRHAGLSDSRTHIRIGHDILHIVIVHDA